MDIPMLDLNRQMKLIRSEIIQAIEAVVDSSKFIMGPEVMDLESEIAAYCSVQHGIGCASGSDAITIALRAVGVQPGDEVITTAYSFYSTAGSIWHIGAKPVFADIDPTTFNIDVNQISDLISPRTKAILPVHLFGQMADMDSIRKFAGSIPIVEDAAQALGAKWDNVPIGCKSHAACLSFYPSKNLGGLGDGGMIVTDDPDVALKSRELRAHGALKTYEHRIVGYNSRLDTIQAAALQVKFRYLNQWTQKRRENAAYYTEAFENSKLGIQKICPQAFSVFNQFVIVVDNRDELQDWLKKNHIGSMIYYPIPLPYQPCFKSLEYKKGDFPHAEYLAAHSLAIPIFPELTRVELDRVISVILDFI
ncbi:MAG: DegT/DnrJ/EryC1/StrS family aminotransferase [bacterium]